MKKMAFTFMVLATTFASCTKEGPLGPEGPIGPAGPDGSIIWSGTATPPPAITGKVGDYYFNTNTRLLYGPKTSGGWGSGTSLQGAQGAPGCIIHTGDGAPASSLGNLGDYYLDRQNHLFYGPKFMFGSPPSAIWGGGLQLGKPMVTYIFADPYFYINGPAVNGNITIPLSAFNATTTSLENGMYLAFYSVMYVVPTISYVWFLATGTTTSQYFYVQHNFSSSTGCWIRFRQTDGTLWATENEFRTNSSVHKIKIIAVPAGIISSLKSDLTAEEIMEELGICKD